MTFKKGNKIGIGRKPWNKGTKGIMKSNKTSFKKGQKAWNKFNDEKMIKNIIEDYKIGKSIGEIRKKFNIGATAIYRILKDNNIILKIPNLNVKNQTKEQTDKIKELNSNRKQSLEEINKRANTLKRLYSEGKIVHHFKGKKFTDEHRKKISLGNTGKKMSKEFGLKVSLRMKNLLKNKENHPLFGKKMKERTKLKIGLANAIANKGKKHSIKQIEKKRIWMLNNNPFKGKHHSENTKEKLKELRKYQIFPKQDTSIEIKIQDYLKQLSIGFFTHYYCDEILNSYQCDIFIPVQKNRDRFIREPIIIECDGDYWHKYPVGRDIDKIRTSELLEKGFKVLRLWEHEIKIMDLDKFKEMII